MRRQSRRNQTGNCESCPRVPCVPMDAFVRASRFISAHDAALLRNAMLEAFGQLESDTDPDAVVRDSTSNRTGYSEWLRQGLATTLLRLAVWSARRMSKRPCSSRSHCREL